MPCTSPITAFQTSSGAVFFSELKRNGDYVRTLSLRCGKCGSCLLERSRQWAVRCLHESRLHVDNCFVTLTYDDDHVTEKLEYRHFQQFMRELRRKFKGRKIRFFACGEYGETKQRPHFHACLFGVDFHDKVFSSGSPSGHRLGSSALLSSIWRRGYASVGALSFASAAYVARYVVKKAANDRGEFVHMSLKPGIGQGWFEQFWSDVYPHDYVVVDGMKQKPPRYYDKLMSRFDGVSFEDITEFNRYWKGRRFDRSDARLKAEEEIVKARMNLLRRHI